MDFINSDDIIIACSTGTISNAAIGLLRISGLKELETVQHFLSIDVKKIRPRLAHYAKVLDNGVEVDDVVLTYFSAPNSYNGENILEIAAHGNVLNIERILNLFCTHPEIRHAGPGEFSYRAYRNKKLNLSQLEGLDLLLNASSPLALEQGRSLLGGALQDAYLSLYDSFLKHKSSIEFFFDFLEDIGEEQAQKLFDESLKELTVHVDKLFKRVSREDISLLSPEITLFGQPNSGKSTFFNLILGEERSIVTNIAGTTRDFISERLKLGGVLFKLIDTAGIRDSADQIEMEGVKRSLKLASQSFFRVLLVNIEQHNAEYFQKIANFSADLILFTHADSNKFNAKIGQVAHDLYEANLININSYNKLESLPKRVFSAGPIEPERNGPIEPGKNGPIEPERNGPIEPGKNGPIEPELYISNLLDESSNLVGYFESLVTKKFNSLIQERPILIERHKTIISDLRNKVSNYSDLSSKEVDVAIVASELNNVGHCISELIGIVSSETVLQNIFKNFCIGK